MNEVVVPSAFWKLTVTCDWLSVYKDDSWLNSATTLASLRIKSAIYDSKEFFGDIAEIIILDRALEDSARQSVERYLNLKYNLY